MFSGRFQDDFSELFGSMSGRVRGDVGKLSGWCLEDFRTMEGRSWGDLVTNVGRLRDVILDDFGTLPGRKPSLRDQRAPPITARLANGSQYHATSQREPSLRD